LRVSPPEAVAYPLELCGARVAEAVIFNDQWNLAHFW